MVSHFHGRGWKLKHKNQSVVWFLICNIFYWLLKSFRISNKFEEINCTYIFICFDLLKLVMSHVWIWKLNNLCFIQHNNRRILHVHIYITRNVFDMRVYLVWVDPGMNQEMNDEVESQLIRGERIYLILVTFKLNVNIWKISA